MASSQNASLRGAAERTEAQARCCVTSRARRCSRQPGSGSPRSAGRAPSARATGTTLAPPPGELQAKLPCCAPLRGRWPTAPPGSSSSSGCPNSSRSKPPDRGSGCAGAGRPGPRGGGRQIFFGQAGETKLPHTQRTEGQARIRTWPETVVADWNPARARVLTVTHGFRYTATRCGSLPPRLHALARIAAPDDGGGGWPSGRLSQPRRMHR